MNSNKSARYLNKHVHPILSVWVLFFGIGLVIGMEFAILHKQKQISTISYINSTPTIPYRNDLITSILPSPTSTQMPITTLTYTSLKLGISFRYTQPQDGTIKAFTKKINNKVYLYFNQQEYAGTDEAYLSQYGYYLEVFYKEPHDALETAIKKQFLQDYPPGDCFVENTSNQMNTTKYPSHYQFAEIRFFTSPDVDMATMLSKAKKCPYPYTRTNAVSYFMSDPKHPDKYVFVGPHQDAPMADDTHTWDETITFL
jgi:hypothetical protein